MKLRVLDTTYKLDSNSISARDVISAIDGVLGDTEYLYSHMIVNGQEVYEEPIAYLESRSLAGIEEILVVAQTRDELFREVMISTAEYLERVIPELDDLSAQFYAGSAEGAWKAFEDLVEGMQWILHSHFMLDQNCRSSAAFSLPAWKRYDEAVHQLESMIGQLMSAVESEDLVLLADLLRYELSPLFRDMRNTLDCLINGGDPLAH